MSALPWSRPGEPSRSPPRLADRLAGHERHFTALWESTSDDLAPLGEPVGRLRRLRNGRHTRRLVDEIARRLERYPEAAAERERWRRDLQRRIRSFGERHFGWPAGYRRLLVADEFWSATVEFVRSARHFAPSISSDDLFQALRNIWIVNSIQMLLDLEVRCTRPAFAYSMLYPWTDNFLDSSHVPQEAKEAFNERLGARLRGVAVEPKDRHEREVFLLVSMIEEELPRPSRGDAWDSLLAIHHAQHDSLAQQAPQRRGPAELATISIRKGGTSVLPDAYLVAPTLAEAEERFLFGYGVFLQLLDDLQDVGRDRVAGHRTLFTVAAERGPLDAPTARLRRFIERCLDCHSPSAGKAFTATGFDDRKDLIRRNCLALLVGAVAEQPKLFTARFRRRLERGWPLSLRRTRRLHDHGRRRLSVAAESLRARSGADSLLDLLCRTG